MPTPKQKTRSAVRDFAEEHNIDIPLPIQLTEYIDKEEAGIKEEKYIQEYKKNGWTLLNKQHGGNLGGIKGNGITYTKEICRELALNYNRRSVFAVECVTAYKYTKLNGWDDYVFAHMPSPKEIYTKSLEKAKAKHRKAVDVYNKDGEFIKTIASVEETSKLLNASVSKIIQVLRKKGKYLVRGYFVKYHCDKFDVDYFKTLTLSKTEYKYGKFSLDGEEIKIYDTPKQVIEENNLSSRQILYIPFDSFKKIEGSLWKRVFILEPIT